MAIKFFYHGTSIKIPKRKKLKQFIKTLFISEGTNLYSLTYIFCTDKYLLSINREFLHHDDYTDIITFCLSDSPDPVAGEIYISAQRVADNANQLGVPNNKELHRVIFHGALHLCGYKDKARGDKKRMTLAEEKYLKMYFT